MCGVAAVPVIPSHLFQRTVPRQGKPSARGVLPLRARRQTHRDGLAVPLRVIPANLVDWKLCASIAAGVHSSHSLIRRLGYFGLPDPESLTNRDAARGLLPLKAFDIAGRATHQIRPGRDPNVSEPILRVDFGVKLGPGYFSLAENDHREEDCG